ncbi:MAG: C_GCAxxG_C_C family protein [Eubacterium sp.]|nr:C_GCAxxG_C_C family protein [Eubacterium sp.]
MERKELAVHLHQNNFNCAQSVVCAFANTMGYDPVIAFRAAEAFGFGMGCQSTCGVVSGMAMVIGLMHSDGDLDNPTTKKECYALMELAYKAFEEKHGTVQCLDLKERGATEEYNPCNDYIKDAVEILDKLLLGL